MATWTSFTLVAMNNGNIRILKRNKLCSRSPIEKVIYHEPEPDEMKVSCPVRWARKGCKVLSDPINEIQGVLSRDEMKKIRAGSGYDCAHTDSNGFDDYYCGLSKADAQAKAADIGGKRCCDSCPPDINPCIA